jgi:hypothetical protein
MVQSEPARLGDVAREAAAQSGDLTSNLNTLNSGTTAASSGFLEYLRDLGSSLCEPPHTFQEVLILLVANISAASAEVEVESG